MWSKFLTGGTTFRNNLDTDALADMVSIMVNKLAYKPPVKDIMDKFYEMFQMEQTKETFSKVPTTARNTRTRTRTQMEID
jgi:hypothetical protein